jgi:hypothetical protein
MPTKAKGKSRFWRKCRIYFRRFRITVWLVILAVLGALIYLNLIGLPDFLKRPLLAKLQEHGVALEFATLRLHWSRGFVAESVRFGSASVTNDPAVPRLTANEVEFNFRKRELFRGHLQVDSMMLRGGKLEWTLTESNAPARTMTITDMDSRLRLLPGDQWLLDDLRGRFSGADFFLSGSLTNASALRDWEFVRPGRAVPTGQWPARLRKLADTLERIAFSSPPELRLDVNGDARDLGSFDARLTVKAAAADTAWGQVQGVLLMARVFPATSNELSRAEISLQAQAAETRWANVTNLDVKARLSTAVSHPDLVDVAATFRAEGVVTPWATVGGSQIKANWMQGITNPIPHSGRMEIHTDSITTWLTRVADFNFTATLASVTNPIASDAALGFWTNLLPYQVQWSTSLGAVRSLGLPADQVSCAGEWNAPVFSITNLEASLYRGPLSGQARLNVVSREASGAVTSAFDIKKIAPLLPKGAQEWLAKFTWAEAPHLSGAVALTLPAWTNLAPDWQAEVRPTLRIAGQVAITNGTYQGIHGDWATTHFSYTNLIWQLPNLAVGRPEGGLRASHTANDATRDYYFKLHSAIDPQAVLPLFTAEVRRGFDLCDFGQPPMIAGELWGRWYEPDHLGFRGQIALTNFSFRGHSTDAIVSGLSYTNLVIECLEPRIWRGTQHLAAAGITADFITKRTYFTNGFSTLDPSVVVQAIGPNVAEVMAPYHFGQPPVARFNGYTSMHDPHDADVVFEGGGGDFESLNFRVSNYAARVHWYRDLLTVTNVTGDFYGGRGAGWARFVFTDDPRAQFTFGVAITNAQLSPLVADVTQKPNNLEGLLSGQLNITNAWTDDFYHSWSGFGNATLRDGLLWELPIFGVLSRPLDAMMPGVGNSKFTEASGTFGIANSVIFSPDLEMRSPAMRLQYRGTVTFEGAISARVTAEPLRDTPVVGSVVSSILSPVAKLFAYRISGTMKEPKSEPIYIPRILMIPLSPFQSLGELFGPEPAKTNAPPETIK